MDSFWYLCTVLHVYFLFIFVEDCLCALGNVELIYNLFCFVCEAFLNQLGWGVRAEKKHKDCLKDSKDGCHREDYSPTYFDF